MEHSDKPILNGYDIRLKSIDIENYRGFSKLSFDFDDNLTVLISENGGGKTTVLDAISECLKIYLNQLLGEKYVLLPAINTLDIKHASNQANAVLKLLYVYPNIMELEKEDEEGNTTIEIELDAKHPIMEEDKTASFSVTKGQTKCYVDDFSLDNTSVFISGMFGKLSNQNLPILAYYGCNSIEINEGILNTDNFDEDSLKVIYSDALTGKRFSFSSFYNWFDIVYNAAITSKDRTAYIMTEVIKNTVNLLLNDSIENLVFSNLRMKYTLKGKNMIIDKKDEDGKITELRVSQLSAGEKIMFALAVDIARKLILANPNAEIPEQIGKDYTAKENLPKYLEGRGVVLLDEIDLHLHPKWQQKVINKLMEIFPNIQFIVTTHSPLVVSNILETPILEKLDRTSRVYELSNQGATPVLHYRGSQIKNIMYEVFGIKSRPELTKQKIDALFESIEYGETEEAKQLFDELKAMLGKNDEAIMDAEYSLK